MTAKFAPLAILNGVATYTDSLDNHVQRMTIEDIEYLVVATRNDAKSWDMLVKDSGTDKVIGKETLIAYADLKAVAASIVHDATA